MVGCGKNVILGRQVSLSLVGFNHLSTSYQMKRKHEHPSFWPLLKPKPVRLELMFQGSTWPCASIEGNLALLFLLSKSWLRSEVFQASVYLYMTDIH